MKYFANYQGIQKQDIDALPEAFQVESNRLRDNFSNHSQERQELLRAQLELVYKQFQLTLDHENMEEAVKKGLLEKARKQIEVFFPGE